MSTELLPVNSTLISSIGHNEKRQELIVQFQSGSRYRYSPVTKSEYDAVMGTGKPKDEYHSVGQFFVKYIRDVKTCEKIETEHPANIVGNPSVESQKQLRSDKPKFERPHQQNLSFKKTITVH